MEFFNKIINIPKKFKNCVKLLINPTQHFEEIMEYITNITQIIGIIQEKNQFFYCTYFQAYFNIIKFNFKHTGINFLLKSPHSKVLINKIKCGLTMMVLTIGIISSVNGFIQTQSPDMIDEFAPLTFLFIFIQVKYIFQLIIIN